MRCTVRRETREMEMTTTYEIEPFAVIGRRITKTERFVAPWCGDRGDMRLQTMVSRADVVVHSHGVVSSHGNRLLVKASHALTDEELLAGIKSGAIPVGFDLLTHESAPVSV